jgi:sterol desaturase/sphingolipid hydroxylase (fatty acid hydroxylase superfamily)
MQPKEAILLKFSIVIYIVLIAGEILLSNYRHKKTYTLKDTIANVYLMLLNSGIDFLFRFVYLLVLQYFFTNKLMQIYNAWVYWLTLLIAEDFIFYWIHRMEHSVRMFWAVHVTHHSSEEYNFTVGFRSSVFQPLYRFIFFIPLALAGFAPLDIMFVFSATQIWGIFVHTKLIHKMGLFEYILVTPSHHRVHHASNIKYLDRNMGMFLIIWDKLFGTFQPELPEAQYQKIVYGLRSKIEKPNPINIVLHEWQSIAKLLKQPIPTILKVKYLLHPPGWSHNGSSKTSNELRKEEG